MGEINDGKLMGDVGDSNSNIVFQADINDNMLTLLLFETYDDGTPNYSTSQTMIFEKLSESDDQQVMQAENEKIKINSINLSEEQIREIENTYGIRPLPGNYWYDSRSGLYGVVGYPAYGFMYAGHDFGTIDQYASAGNTGVIINGRELPQSEWAVWSYILNYWIQPGAYWMDEQGNAGYEGVDVPMVNLFVAAQQNSYNGQGGSGDNFWSSRYGAGNYDSGNQRGYVSVPGHGPVGYGF
ncbi:hypothetical protein ACFLRZ_04975 [Bacteroidota bacterium]